MANLADPMTDLQNLPVSLRHRQTIDWWPEEGPKMNESPDGSQCLDSSSRTPMPKTPWLVKLCTVVGAGLSMRLLFWRMLMFLFDGWVGLRDLVMLTILYVEQQQRRLCHK